MEKEVLDIIQWIKQYVENSGAKGVVIGNSGGKDSAVVIALCTKALGNDKVLTVAMPCSSIKEDLEYAKLVSDKFNVSLLKVDITKTYEELKQSIELGINKELQIEPQINIRPRLRMTTLYAIAQQNGYLVAGTGNLCEATVGYTTKWGDNACDFNPLANFLVEEVLEIARILGVPEEIINKAPNDGLGMGTDEEKMGVTYKEISEYINTGKTNEKALEIIEKLNKRSRHKREKIPVYIRK